MVLFYINFVSLNCFDLLICFDPIFVDLINFVSTDSVWTFEPVTQFYSHLLISTLLVSVELDSLVIPNSCLYIFMHFEI